MFSLATSVLGTSPASGFGVYDLTARRPRISLLLTVDASQKPQTPSLSRESSNPAVKPQAQNPKTETVLKQ